MSRKHKSLTVAVVFGLLAILIVVFLSVGSWGIKESSKDETTSSSTSAEQSSLEVGETKEMEGFEIEPVSFYQGLDTFSEYVSCVDVRVKNVSDSPMRISQLDFKLDTEKVLENPSFRTIEEKTHGLVSGEVAPGGVETGSICFSIDPETRGEMNLVYKRFLGFTDDIVEWKVK